MGILFINGKFQAFDASGDPLSGGKLYSYASGTTTPKDTYTSKALTPGTENTNPVILDSRGEAVVYMSTGDYKFILKTSDDTLIWTADLIESDTEIAAVITTEGDIIQGGTGGAAERLAVGTEGQMPTVTSGKLAYKTPESPVVLTNKSGGILAANDVVVPDTANDSAITTTTTRGDTRPILIVSSSAIGINATGQFSKVGVVTVNVQGNVARGNYLRTSTTAKRSEDAGSSPDMNGVFAMALTAYAGGGAGTVSALLLGRTNVSAVGRIEAYGGTVAPSGWLLCNGSAVSQTTYADLYAIIATAFNTGGEGAGNFRLPDLRQRFPLGKAASGTGSTLGGTGGQIDLTHSHVVSRDGWSKESGTTEGRLRVGNGSDTVDLAGGNTDTGQSVTLYPPYQAVNYIIKY